MKKIVAILLIAATIVTCAACTAQTPAASSAPAASVAAASSAAPASSAAASSAAPAAQITLNLWNIATESDSFHVPYQKAIEDYQKAHPNVKIVQESFENESYKTKIKAAVAANELPDIFYTWGGGFSQSFVDSGRVLAVDDTYAKYTDSLPKTMTGNLTYNGKLYGSSYILNVSMLFYNKKMFDQYGLKAPTTYDELKAVCQKFIDNKITPFGISAKDKWVLAQTHDAMTLKSVGPTSLTSALTKDGKTSYNSAGFLDASQKFVDLIKMGAYSKDAIGLSNDEACATFYAGKVPMFIMGSWMPGSIYTDAPNPEDFGVVPVPVLNSQNAKLTDFMGGPSDSLMVAASTKYPKEAAEAMFEIAKSVSHYGYLAGCGLPAWKVDYDDSTVKPLTKQVTDYVSKATSFTLWFDTLMQAEDASVYLDNLQQLYTGDVAPKDFVGNVAKQLEKK
jgi:raffinose/stachyose/melibiose transport system substrate-binding protein